MTGTSPTYTSGATSLDAALAQALAVLFPGDGDGAGDATLVFSGEGAAPGLAVEDALEDIHHQARTHGGTPVGVRLDGWLRTDTGVRIWGTLGIDASGTPRDATPAKVSIEEEEEGRWSLTISSP